MSGGEIQASQYIFSSENTKKLQLMGKLEEKKYIYIFIYVYSDQVP